jgi:hypothetical protein
MKTIPFSSLNLSFKQVSHFVGTPVLLFSRSCSLVSVFTFHIVKKTYDSLDLCQTITRENTIQKGICIKREFQIRNPCAQYRHRYWYCGVPERPES